MAKKQQSLSIVYDEVEGKQVLAVTGAYGGPSPDGTSVVAHVYTEFGTPPSIEEHEIQDGGVVDLEKGNKIRRADVTRQIQATLVMSPEAARTLGKFLVERSEIALQRRGKEKKK